MKRVFPLIPFFSGSVKSTTSFPMNSKVGFLHFHKMPDNLRGIVPLRPETVASRFLRPENIHHHAEPLAEAGDGSVGVLAIPAEINAQDAAVLKLVDETADAIGIIFPVHAARPRSPALRENEEVLSAGEDGITFLKGPFHLFPIPAAMDGNALGEIAKKGQQGVPLKIVPLQQIPGKHPETDQMAVKGEKAVSQDHGIHHGQMVGTDDPGPPVFPELRRAGPSQFLQVPHPVSPEFQPGEIRRSKDEDSKASPEGLKL
jgi:hypothetical protein